MRAHVGSAGSKEMVVMAAARKEDSRAMGTDFEDMASRTVVVRDSS
jgi:hypothetical protein